MWQRSTSLIANCQWKNCGNLFTQGHASPHHPLHAQQLFDCGSFLKVKCAVHPLNMGRIRIAQSQTFFILSRMEMRGASLPPCFPHVCFKLKCSCHQSLPVYAKVIVNSLTRGRTGGETGFHG